MPGGDRTGPMGMGSMTGRGLGFCTDNYRTEGAFRQFGSGFGRGRGMGFKRSPQRFMEPYPESYSSETEVEALHRKAEGLKNNLDQVEKRLSQLEKEPVEEKEK